MPFEPEKFYHIYNRGNNKGKIFFTEANYKFFLQKIKKEILPCCDLVAYCLMPNHYHILLYFGTKHSNFRQAINMQNLERKIGTLQSSYARAINHQEGRVGSLFQQKFKVVPIDNSFQGVTCFNYIHRNPVKAGLAEGLEDWRYSSFTEYFRLQKGICEKDIAYTVLNIPCDAEQLIRQTINFANLDGV